MEGKRKFTLIMVSFFFVLLFTPTMIKADGGPYYPDSYATEKDKREEWASNCVTYANSIAVKKGWGTKSNPAGSTTLGSFLDPSMQFEIKWDAYKTIVVNATVKKDGQPYTEKEVEVSLTGRGYEGNSIARCIWGGYDIVNNMHAGKSNKSQGSLVTDFVPDGTYTLYGLAPSEGILSWLNPLSVAKEALVGKPYVEGTTTFTVKTVDGSIKVFDASGKDVTNSDEGVVLSVKDVNKGGVLGDLIQDSVNKVIEGMNKVAIMGIAGINSMLRWESKEILKPSTLGVAWEKIRNLTLSLLTLILILIAFANALQYNIEKFGLNRIIPKIIVAIILSYLSWAIAGFLFDLTNAFQNTAWEIANNQDLSAFTQGEIISSADAAAELAALVVAVVVMVIVCFSIFALFITLIVRVVMLSFLIVVSPLAFMLNILPFTEQYYKRWWKDFLKWMIMGPIVVMILAIGMVILNGNAAPGITGSGTGIATVTPSEISSPSGVQTLIRLFIFAGCVVFASIIPLTLGGKLMDKIGMSKMSGEKLARRASSRAWQGTGVPQRTKNFLAARKSSKAERRELKDNKRRAAIAEKGGSAGRFIAGVNKDQADTLGQRARANWVKSRNPDQYTADEMHDKMYKAYRSGKKFEAKAWAEHLAASGNFNRGTGGKASNSEESKANEALNQHIFDEFAPGNGVITNGVAKGDNDVFLSSANTGFVGRGLTVASKKDVSSLGTGEVKALGALASGTSAALNGFSTGDKADSMNKAKAILSKIDSEQISRVASRQGGAILESYANESTVQHLNDRALQKVHQKLQERGYDTMGKDGGPSTEYTNVITEMKKRNIPVNTSGKSEADGGNKGREDRGDSGDFSNKPPKPTTPVGSSGAAAHATSHENSESIRTTATAVRPNASTQEDTIRPESPIATSRNITSPPKAVPTDGHVWGEKEYEQRTAHLPENVRRNKNGEMWSPQDLGNLEDVLGVKSKTLDERVEAQGDILRPGAKPTEDIIGGIEYLQSEHPSVEMQKKLGSVDGIKNPESKDRE